ncbi:MAG TPA: hypothetical protein VHM24_04885 [Gemmatimonadaceae bacterium]|nr:hypothetical protein [Gemmatimonadaceae bacterium]
MDAAPRPKSRDLGAALAGLVLGGSVLFLLVLTIVWLTNARYAGEKSEDKAGHVSPPATPVVAPGPVPSTTGTGTAAPVAPTPQTAPATKR